MAPKTPASLSRHPSKEKPENKPPNSDEEEEEDDDDLEEVEEEEDDDDEAEEGSSEEEEEEDTDLQKVEKNIKTPIPVAKIEAEPNAQDGSDSDTDSDGSPSDYKLQPIPKPSSTPAKRTHEEGDDARVILRSCKKSKTEEKKPSSSVGCITRLWSNDDEIAVLNGMIEFRDTKQVDPTSDLLAFHDYVKGKLQGDFSREQLKTKISRLKKRFLNALKKGENGADPVFSKPHEDWLFELSKKIWGGNSVGGKKIESTKKDSAKGKEAKKDNAKGKEAKKDNVKGKEVVADEKEIVKEENGVKELDFWSKYKSIRESFCNLAVKFPSLAMSETGMRSVTEKLSLIGDADAKQLNDKWKKLIMEETELNYKMMILMDEQLKMAFGQ